MPSKNNAKNTHDKVLTYYHVENFCQITYNFGRARKLVWFGKKQKHKLWHQTKLRFDQGRSHWVDFLYESGERRDRESDGKPPFSQ